MGYSLPGQSRQLFRDAFVAIVDVAHPVLQESDLAVTHLARLPHAVGYFGNSITTPADRLLESLGSAQRATAKMRGLLALPMLVEGTDLMALVPRMLAIRASRGGRLAILDFSVEVEAILVESMYWHPSHSEDPATLWLRDVLKRASEALHETHGQTPAPRRTVDIGGMDS